MLFDIAIIATLVVAPIVLVVYSISRLFEIRSANHRGNISHPDYHVHDNWHDHEDDTLSGK